MSKVENLKTDLVYWRKTRSLQILFCLLVGFQIGYGQSIDEQLDSYLSSYEVEKIYVHHDRPSYMQGDTMWCKVYYLDGDSHEFIQEQSIIYAEWISPQGELLETYNLKTEEGRALVDIVIDPLANTGEYTLKVYTLYQLNFHQGSIFQKKIKVTGYEDEVVKNETDGKFKIQFFPEGGYLIDGSESRVGFKAVDKAGKNISVSGKVVNGSGLEVASLKTSGEGLGMFDLTPEVDQVYTAVLDVAGVQQKVELPKVLEEGYSMNISSTTEDIIEIIINASEKVDLNDCLIVGEQKGETFLNQTIADKNKTVLDLEKSDLPYGLLHFTLFDIKNRPVSERLIYNTLNGEEIEVDLEIAEDILDTKSANKAWINSEDLSVQYKANVSLSVYNKQYTEGASGLNIKNYLELQSELRGKVNNINRYFEEDNSESRAQLDLLLMTHGWSKFTWQEVLSNNPKEILYPKETTFSLSGQVVKAKKDEPVKADLIINVLDQQEFLLENLTTEDEGNFYIADLGIQDSTNIFIQANVYDENNKEKLKDGKLKKSGDSNVDIKLIDLKEFNFDPSLSMLIDDEDVLSQEEKEAQVKEVIESKLGLENLDSSLWSLSIDEVTVKGKKFSRIHQRSKDTKRKYRARKMFYIGHTDKFYAEDLYRYQDKFIDIYDMIATAWPGTTITGPRGDRRIGVKGTPEVPIALNDELVSSSYLDFIDPEQVEIIEIIGIMDPQFAIGLFGYPLVVRVVTKTDNPLLGAKIAHMTRGTLNIAHPGFYKAKEYYKKMYDEDVFTSESDERVTLYWEPNIDLNGERYMIEFSTGDLEGEHVIHLEGITEDGMPVVASKTFYVESKEP